MQCRGCFLIIRDKSLEQLVVPEACVMQIIRALHNSPVRGHPGSKKVLHELRKRYYLPKLAIKVQKVINSCATYIKSKTVEESLLRQPVQKNYDPFEGPEDM